LGARGGGAHREFHGHVEVGVHLVGPRLLVPGRVELAHARGERRAHRIVHLAIGGLDAVVDAVDVLNEVAVHFFVEHGLHVIG